MKKPTKKQNPKVRFVRVKYEAILEYDPKVQPRGAPAYLMQGKRILQRGISDVMPFHLRGRIAFVGGVKFKVSVVNQKGPTGR
jgi:hypothetical protein